jgi:hypothetical protein
VDRFFNNSPTPAAAAESSSTTTNNTFLRLPTLSTFGDCHYQSEDGHSNAPELAMRTHSALCVGTMTELLAAAVGPTFSIFT